MQMALSKKLQAIRKTVVERSAVDDQNPEFWKEEAAENKWENRDADKMRRKCTLHRNMHHEWFLTQLRTASVLTPHETEDIQAQILSLSMEFAHLEALIRDLSAQRDEIQESIALRKAVVYPIRRLPDDVLQEIFLAVLPPLNAAMSVSEAPLLLCRICSAWRALALDTPTLWSTLHIHLGFTLLTSTRTHAVREWLKRSAACPLSLSISGPPADLNTPGYSSHTSHIFLFDTLFRSAARWRELSLTDISSDYLKELGAITTPLLTAIHIDASEDIEDWIDAIEKSSIRSLSLSASPVAGQAPTLLPALKHITHLSISNSWQLRGVPGTLATAILHNLPQLVQQLKQPPISPSSSHWTYWIITETLHPALASLFDDLVMPQLHHLSLKSTLLTESNAPLFATLKERSPLLHSLSINLLNFTRSALRESLANVPSLASLVVQDAKERRNDPDLPQATTTYLLGLLINRRSTPSVCPVLRSLESTGCFGVDHAVLSAFSQARSLDLSSQTQNVDVSSQTRPIDTSSQSHRLSVPPPFRLAIDFGPSCVVVPDVERFRCSGLHISLTQTRQWPVVL
ncbi:hypothetical protein C8R43DRAFT_1106507 [Mycena crocata]|nr:hypothetical protein C8R43DRAFT_1106507 [Mycena crocata]